MLRKFADSKIILTFAPQLRTKRLQNMLETTGEMAEWSIAAVLKTVELRGSGGSNPSLSAIKGVNQAITRFTPFFAPKKQFEYFCNIVLPNYFSSLEFLSEFARNK